VPLLLVPVYDLVGVLLLVDLPPVDHLLERPSGQQAVHVHVPALTQAVRTVLGLWGWDLGAWRGSGVVGDAVEVGVVIAARWGNVRADLSTWDEAASRLDCMRPTHQACAHVHAPPRACRSWLGSQLGSNTTTLLAAVRLSPTPPAAVETSRQKTEGRVLNFSATSCLSRELRVLR